MRRVAGIVVSALCGAFFGLFGTAAFAAQFEEGKHYLKLPIAVETDDPSKIEVVEVFSYACIHCYRLEPTLETWKQTLPADVDFRRLPLVSSRLEDLAKAFYAAESLGVQKQLHMAIFEAIHEHGIDMTRRDYLRRWFEREAQVGEDAFNEAFDSFGVQGRVRQADAQARSYRISATPTIVVNGRYVAEVSMAGSNEAMFLVVNHLIGLERERMSAQTTD